MSECVAWPWPWPHTPTARPAMPHVFSAKAATASGVAWRGQRSSGGALPHAGTTYGTGTVHRAPGHTFFLQKRLPGRQGGISGILRRLVVAARTRTQRRNLGEQNKDFQKI